MWDPDIPHHTKAVFLEAWYDGGVGLLHTPTPQNVGRNVEPKTHPHNHIGIEENYYFLVVTLPGLLSEAQNETHSSDMVPRNR
ncbi:hypothetical protein E2C01_047372 [Portunus trituberculatus]|uniref:Uncharacterized protein n=1 Tax=Portunus trituberculatus TaxID=210409 RepID=A0A5B7G8N4_PORTR|nr:hypothetical protein [Portunus trituberculatus]